VLYDELNRNVRDMTTDESNFIRDCLDDMDTWIQNAERKFGRANASQSCRRIASANRDEMNRRWEMWENLSEEKKQVLLDDYDVENETDLEKALEMCDDSYLIEDSEDTYDIYSGCHGKSDKRRREKKEDELESSRRSVKSSPDINLRNRARELFRRFDSLTPDSKEDILTRFNVTDEDDLADYVMAYGNASAIDELDNAVAEAESGVKSSRNARTFSKFNRISSLFIKNDFFAEGEECIVEIKEDGKWKMVSLDNTPEGWSTKKKAKVFKSEKDARKSALIGRLNDAGYSEEAGNLRFSVN
jgi:hypothetical protein